MIKKRWLKYGLVGLMILLVGGILVGSNYLVSYAFTRGIPGPSNHKKAAVLKADQVWLKNVKQEQWQQRAANSSLRLVATYVPAAKATNKTIIVAHGYHENHTSMASYIRLFHNLGYNVLAPDNRGSGKSQGKYLTFGWLDRLDYVNWIKKVIKYQGQNSQIGLFGVSMGGATVMMVSGQKLPSQVKAIVEDCGYSSVEAELTNQLKAQFNLPKEPFIMLASMIAKIRVGFDFRQAKATAALRKNTLPLYLIHGDSDHFVATKMVKQNYAAQAGTKKLWISKKTGHAMTYYNYPHEYQQRVGAFFAKYLQ